MSGPLRTTLDLYRLLVQQIYVRTANNTPISTNYVLLADGQGGTYFAPASGYTEYGNLSTLVMQGNTQFLSTINGLGAVQIGQNTTVVSTLSGQISTSFQSIYGTQGVLSNQIVSLSNLVRSISDYSAYITYSDARFSTLSSYVNNLTQTYTPLSTTNAYFNSTVQQILSTQSSVLMTYSTLAVNSAQNFSVNSTQQANLFSTYNNNLLLDFSSLRSQTGSNYSSLSTIRPS